MLYNRATLTNLKVTVAVRSWGNVCNHIVQLCVRRPLPHIIVSHIINYYNTYSSSSSYVQELLEAPSDEDTPNSRDSLSCCSEGGQLSDFEQVYLESSFDVVKKYVI